MVSNNIDYKQIYDDRYFKYRFTEAMPLKTGVVKESLAIEQQVGVYHATMEYGRRLHNISVQLESLDYFEMSYFPVKNEVLPGIQMIYMPTNYAMFSNDSRWTYLGIYASSDTYIISAEPRLKLVTSADLLGADTETMTLLFLSIFSISLALSFNVFKDKYSSLKTPWLKSFAKTLFGKIWDITSLIFFEPLEPVSNYLSDRIVLGGWLVSLSFFYCVLSCYLKSEFFQEEYLVIDNLDQLIKQTRLKPLLLDKGYEYFYIKDELASKDDAVKNWFDKIKLVEALEIFSWEFYYELCDGGALVISDMVLKWSLGALVEWGVTDQIKQILEMGGLYVSRSIVRSELLIIPVDREIFKEYPLFREYFTVAIMAYFETKSFHHMDMYNKYPLDLVSWSIPTKTNTQITLFAVSVPFYILPIGFSISLLALLLECLSRSDTFKMGCFKCRRNNRINAVEENLELEEIKNLTNDQAPIEDKQDNEVSSIEENQETPAHEIVEEGEIRLRTWSNLTRRGPIQPTHVSVSRKEGETTVLAWEIKRTPQNIESGES